MYGVNDGLVLITLNFVAAVLHNQPAAVRRQRSQVLLSRLLDRQALERSVRREDKHWQTIRHLGVTKLIIIRPRFA